ncbi:MAG: hypothetical protein IT480_05195 [Gammaproteobacteria bacterium]|nr:hypothetical protein [Gammaproteobacteria bacterium]
MAAAPWLRQLRPTRRLAWLVVLALLVVGAELALRAWDAQQRLGKELHGIRSRAAVLAASDDRIDWNASIRAAERQRDQLRARLWQSPTQAQAQARLRDWLGHALRSAAAAHPAVTLLPLSAAAAAAPAAAEPSAGPASSAAPIVRVRATVAFDLVAGALENALVQIEGGGQLARVDSLGAATASRRVEMTVSVPVMIMQEGR